MFENPTAKTLHVEHINIVNNATLAGSNRIYFPYIPAIETGYIVGVFSLRGRVNISENTILPQNPSTNLNSVTNPSIRFVTVTLVNKAGVTLISEYPYLLLFPDNGNITPLHLVNLDTKKCFFQFVPGFVVPTNSITAPLAFYLKNN
jgi:hypothetical protein